MAAHENVLSAQPFYPNKPSFSCPSKTSLSLPLPQKSPFLPSPSKPHSLSLPLPNNPPFLPLPPINLPFHSPHPSKNPPKSPRNNSVLAYSVPLYYT